MIGQSKDLRKTVKQKFNSGQFVNISHVLPVRKFEKVVLP